VVLGGEVGAHRTVRELLDDRRRFGFHPLMQCLARAHDEVAVAGAATCRSAVVTEVRIGRGPLATLCPYSGRCSGVAELALGGLDHAGAVLVLALVAANCLDPGVVALVERGSDFLHTQLVVARPGL
jgi:hypothetical protein